MAVPLVCEIVFILVLTVLLGQVEREAYRAEHSRSVMAATDRLVTLFYQAGTALASYDVTKNPLFKLSYEKTTDRTVAQMLLIRRLTQDDHSADASLNEIDSTVSEMLKTMEVIANKIDRGESPFAGTRESLESLHASGDRFASKAAELTAVQRRINAAEPEHEARLRGMVEQCLYAGVFLNCVLAIGLARAFYRGTAFRLNILMQNTQRLAKQQPLHPPIDGSDEIAELDTVFRQMASALDDAAKQKQQVLAMVSHDLRSPLTAAQISLDLMCSGVKGAISSDVRNEMQSIQNSIGRLVRLINDLLDVEKLEQGKLELRKQEVNLEVIVDNCIETINPLAELKKITVEPGDLDLDLYADGERLTQVVINIVSNAIKAAPENSKITISAAVEDDQVTVEIMDSGPGIEAQHLETIFDRYTQTPDTQGGTGLGLAICKAIIEQHGGMIGVHSEPGKGSTFWFSIPMQPAPPLIENPAVNNSAAPPTDDTVEIPPQSAATL